MKGDYLLGDKKFRLDKIPVPGTGEYDVLIRVTTCGICDTDAHIYHESKGSAEVHPPVTLGHELAGIVKRTGSAVTTVKPGDRVTVDSNSYYGKRHRCKVGKKQVCENPYAVDANKDGGFAQYCIISETQCYQPDKETPSKYGAMTELLVCCIHEIGRIGLVPGNTVCVIGGGIIGFIMVQLIKLSGASKMVLNEPVSMRREIGMKVGADTVIDPVYEKAGQRLTEILGTPGADVAVEHVGVPAAAEQAFKIADKGAVILFFSAPSLGSIYAMYSGEIFQRELVIVGSIISSDIHGRAVTLINSNVIQLGPPITHLFPLDQLEQAILAQQGSEFIKAIAES